MICASLMTIKPLLDKFLLFLSSATQSAISYPSKSSGQSWGTRQYNANAVELFSQERKDDMARKTESQNELRDDDITASKNFEHDFPAHSSITDEERGDSANATDSRRDRKGGEDK
jgi:hypothetical protein